MPNRPAHCRYGYPPQDPHEFETLCELVRVLKPHRMLEVGSRHGQSTTRLAEAALPGLLWLTCIDMPDLAWGHKDSEANLRYAAEELENRGVTVDLLMVNSHGPEAKEWAQEHAGRVDFIFLDGDHTLQGVREDFDTFSPCLAPGGVIAFHDIDGQGKQSRGQTLGVPAFWAWLKGSGTMETWEYNAKTGYGVGVARKAL